MTRKSKKQGEGSLQDSKGLQDKKKHLIETRHSEIALCNRTLERTCCPEIIVSATEMRREWKRGNDSNGKNMKRDEGVNDLENIRKDWKRLEVAPGQHRRHRPAAVPLPRPPSSGTRPPVPGADKD